MRAVCPGSFDPVTLGHVDVVRRAATMFDEVVVAVAVNPNKQGMFTVDERRELIAGAVGDLPNVSTAAFTGLLVDWCREQGVDVIAKGLRSDTDYAYELPMAQMNRHLTGVDTVFLTADPAHTFVSSSLVKEVARGARGVTGRLGVPDARGARGTDGSARRGVRPAAVAADRHAGARSNAPSAGGAAAHWSSFTTQEVADVYRVFEALDELVTICEEARGVPMTSSCVVPRGDVLELLDDIREAIPGELDDAQDVLDHRDQLVNDATDEAEKARAEARTEADRILAEAREQAQQMIAEAEHEAERVVSRGRREYADLTDHAAAEADRMAEAGRQSYDRAVADGRAEQQRLVSEHAVTLAARDEAGRIVERAADDAHRARADCDSYVDTALAEFTETLESVLDTVGRHRHQLRNGQVGASSREGAHDERADDAARWPDRASA